MVIPPLYETLRERPQDQSNLWFDLVRGQLVITQKFISSPPFG
ncbi:hypothetical protein [Nostoc sp.]